MNSGAIRRSFVSSFAFGREILFWNALFFSRERNGMTALMFAADNDVAALLKAAGAED